MTRFTGRRTLATAFVGIAALALGACGAGSDGGGSGGADDGASAAPVSVKLARTSSLDSGEINDMVGPIEIGPTYGLKVSEADVTDYQSPSTALQVMLSGKADVVTGSAISTLQAIEQGPPGTDLLPAVGRLRHAHRRHR